MIPAEAPPVPDQLVECLFEEIILPPEGYEYHGLDGQLLFPCHGQDKWRILLHKKGTEISNATLVPVFIEGSFVRKLGIALDSLQREVEKSIADDIPDPVSKVAH